MATHIEYDEWKRGENEEEVEVKERVKNIKKAVDVEDNKEDDVLNKKHKDLFDELFGDK